ncbi:MAG: alpha/beta fold hydrolase [Rhodovarius sp.]|nr:alpha/beta fold hydrolase [Rhodovarius sp.]MCX7932201.1 alpha/beta fold hydrolase [Rhodovarius sp.]
MTDHPIWGWDAQGWPHAEHSRFREAAGIRWHLQRLGRGPKVLLLHGTGAATHTWRGVLPLLAPCFEVLALDLPGHGFTSMPLPSRMGIGGMAADIATLLEAEGFRPDILVGHSAGAVIAVRLALDGLAPRRILSINGALLPLSGPAGQLFAPIARFLAGLPFVAPFLAWRAADRATVERLLRDTGSVLDAEGVELYARLFRRAGHVQATLTMMARWDLHGFRAELPRLGAPLTLIAATGDRTIAPATAREVQRLLPHAEVVEWPGLGHLAHEERPDLLAALLAPICEPA